MTGKMIKSSQKGFTLVELLVAFAVVSVLIVIAIIVFDPIAQFEKARDAQRKHDLGQIQKALDVYYNDHSCYPLSLSFGSSLTVGSTVYMNKIPQDPDYPFKVYQYQVNPTDACPQWNVLYASLWADKGSINNSCTFNICGGPQYVNAICTSGTKLNKCTYCIPSGNINDCSATTGVRGSLPFYGTIPQTPTPGPTSTPTPTGGIVNYYRCPDGPGPWPAHSGCNSTNDPSICQSNDPSSRYYCYPDQASCAQACPGP